jgi:hypothetical protein
MQIIDDWLEDWLSAEMLKTLPLGLSPGPGDDMTARLCRDAVGEGYDIGRLQDACDGNIRQFLERHRGRMLASLPLESMAGSALA